MLEMRKVCTCREQVQVWAEVNGHKLRQSLRKHCVITESKCLCMIYEQYLTQIVDDQIRKMNNGLFLAVFLFTFINYHKHNIINSKRIHNNYVKSMNKASKEDLNLEDFLQQFQQIIDFKVVKGERHYRSTWLTGDRKISKKWLPLDQLRSYLKEVLDYEEKDHSKILEIESQWNDMFNEGKVSQRLQTLNTSKLKKMFKCQKQPIEQEEDSDYEINQKKIQKIAKLPIIKKKTKQSKKRSRLQNKVFKKKQAKPSFTRKKVIKNRKINKSKVQQNIVKDREQLSLKNQFEDKLNSYIHQVIQPKKTAKMSLDFSSLITQTNKQPLPLIEIQKVDDLVENKSVMDEGSGDQLSQAVSPMAGLSRAVLTDQSQKDSLEEEEQFQYESQPLSEIVDHNQIKEFIEVKLKQIEENQKLDLHAKQEDDDKQVKFQQENQAYIDEQYQQNLRQSIVSLQEVISDDFEHKVQQLKNVRNYELPQGFAQLIASKMLNEQDLKSGRVRVNNIISLYNLKNFCYFSVNIGNNYYEEQRFLEYRVLKQKFLPILLKWLNIDK